MVNREKRIWLRYGEVRSQGASDLQAREAPELHPAIRTRKRASSVRCTSVCTIAITYPRSHRQSYCLRMAHSVSSTSSITNSHERHTPNLPPPDAKP